MDFVLIPVSFLRLTFDLFSLRLKEMLAIDNNNTVLLLLHLSATFDTVDHPILLSRLFSGFWIKRTVLARLRSYLTSRKQFINVI